MCDEVNSEDSVDCGELSCFPPHVRYETAFTKHVLQKYECLESWTVYCGFWHSNKTAASHEAFGKDLKYEKHSSDNCYIRSVNCSNLNRVYVPIWSTGSYFRKTMIYAMVHKHGNGLTCIEFCLKAHLFREYSVLVGFMVGVSRR